MSEQPGAADLRMAAEDPRGSGDRLRERSTERAFVIQFDRPDRARRRFRGRVELVASGEAIRFRSIKQLVAFMVGVLRRRTTAEQ